MRTTAQTIDEYKEEVREAQNAIARLYQWGIKNGLDNRVEPMLKGGESVGLNEQ